MHDVAHVAAFGAAGHFGADGHGVSIAPTTIGAAWNAQGRLDDVAFAAATRVVFDVVLPVAPNATARGQRATALWLGPRSWLVASGDASRFPDLGAARSAINAAGGALFDVTCGRVAWTLSGPHATDVLASGCPLDLHASTFRAADCAQTLFGHVNALIEKRDDTPTFVLMVARSFARDVEHALATVAAQYGCDVLPAMSY